MTSFSKINKFSQKVFKFIITVAAILIICGLILLDKYTYYEELFIARKLLETGFCLFPLSLILTILTDYIYNKTAS